MSMQPIVGVGSRGIVYGSDKHWHVLRSLIEEVDLSETDSKRVFHVSSADITVCTGSYGVRCGDHYISIPGPRDRTPGRGYKCQYDNKVVCIDGK